MDHRHYEELMVMLNASATRERFKHVAGTALFQGWEAEGMRLLKSVDAPTADARDDIHPEYTKLVGYVIRATQRRVPYDTLRYLASILGVGDAMEHLLMVAEGVTRALNARREPVITLDDDDDDNDVQARAPGPKRSRARPKEDVVVVDDDDDDEDAHSPPSPPPFSSRKKKAPSASRRRRGAGAQAEAEEEEEEEEDPIQASVDRILGRAFHGVRDSVEARREARANGAAARLLRPL